MKPLKFSAIIAILLVVISFIFVFCKSHVSEMPKSKDALNIIIDTDMGVCIDDLVAMHMLFYFKQTYLSGVFKL